MNVFVFLGVMLRGCLARLFPRLSYKGVVNTQIELYRYLKKEEPELEENEILNLLILTRIQAPPRIGTLQQELRYYDALLQRSDKTLEDVVRSIVEYEYIYSRYESIEREASGIGESRIEMLSNISTFLRDVSRYIREQIKTQNARTCEKGLCRQEDGVIEQECYYCGERMELPGDCAGEEISCPGCGNSIIVSDTSIVTGLVPQIEARK